jgi:hypothetical protein
MKITITGEHAGKSTTIAIWECSSEVVEDTSINVEDEIMDVIKQQMVHYINKIVREE